MKVRNILALMLFAGIFTSSCSNKNANQKIAQTSPDSVNERIMDMKNNPNKWAYKGTRPAIIDFYATWCGPCKITAPILDSLAFEYKGKLEVYKVDVDKQRELASMFGIESIPSLLFIPIKGQPLMQVGAMGRADLEKIIKEKLLK